MQAGFQLTLHLYILVATDLFMAKQEYKTISQRAQKLLSGSETTDIEFKESVGGIKSDDLVAFANSRTGGTILIGIRESETEDGRQRGEIIGADIGDKAKLSILNRAANCIPPIQLDIIIENANAVPFLRIEIPSGRDKPYSTGGGTYKIRGNARTNTLAPTQLLALFMESESQKFIERFSNATEQLEADLEGISTKLALLEQRMGAVFSQLDTHEHPSHGELQKLEAKIDALLAKLD